MAEQVETNHVRKKGRSPSYPGVDLQEAIERACLLYDKETRNWAPVETALEHWGYSARSGVGSVVLAALKKYGLIEDQGQGTKRMIRLSDMGFEIAIDRDDDSPERAELVREAALKPGIHSELWEQYSAGLPSDSTLRRTLLRDRGFTERAVSEFIPQFRRTLQFAGLIGDDAMLKNGEDKPREGAPPMMTPPANPMDNPTAGTAAAPAPPRQRPPMIIPIAPNEYVTLQIQADAPLTEAKWERMLKVLEAFKFGLVETELPTTQEDSHQE